MHLDFLAAVKSGALLLIVAMCVFSSYRPLKQAAEPEPQPVYERRFEEVRKVLPKHGVVGYFTDAPGDVGAYYLTQYALTPLVVDNSIDHHFVIGNFSDAHPRIPQNHDWVLVRDFGSGVVLIENRGR